MSSLLNVLPETPRMPRPSVLLLAHPELGEPTARYLRRIGCEVTFPLLSKDATAEECARLLFPEVKSEGDGRFLSLFTWSAFDAVVIQDLWPSEEERRLIAFGCTVAATDYYVRGNFHQPKIVIVTDPAFYGCRERDGGACDRYLRRHFDQNEQIDFVPLVGAESSLSALERIGRTVVRRTTTRARALSGSDGLTTSDDSEQRRGLAVLSSALVRYVEKRARLVVVDDSAKTIGAIADRFGLTVKPDKQQMLHVLDVRERQIQSYSSFDDLQHAVERLVRESRRAHELLLVLTDILFDGVEWDGERKTGVDLIHLFRLTQRAHRAKVGVVGLTGVASPLVMTSAFHQGADAVVTKIAREGTSINHATDVDDAVMYKTLLTLGFLCFQSEFLADKRKTVEHAREELAALRRILPSHAVSPHLQAEWEDTQYLLEAQATYVQDSRPAGRIIERIRQQYN